MRNNLHIKSNMSSGLT